MVHLLLPLSALFSIHSFLAYMPTQTFYATYFSSHTVLTLTLLGNPNTSSFCSVNHYTFAYTITNKVTIK